MKTTIAALLLLGTLVGCGATPGSTEHTSRFISAGIVDVNITGLMVNNRLSKDSPVKAGLPVKLSAVVNHRGPGTLTYTWLVTGGTISGTGAQATYQNPSPGDHIVTCVIKDTDGGGDTSVVALHVAR